jgi:hypothetical protein
MEVQKFVRAEAVGHLGLIGTVCLEVQTLTDDAAKKAGANCSG